jgi:hypothetical protein
MSPLALAVMRMSLDGLDASTAAVIWISVVSAGAPPTAEGPAIAATTTAGLGRPVTPSNVSRPWIATRIASASAVRDVAQVPPATTVSGTVTVTGFLLPIAIRKVRAVADRAFQSLISAVWVAASSGAIDVDEPAAPAVAPTGAPSTSLDRWVSAVGA